MINPEFIIFCHGGLHTKGALGNSQIDVRASRDPCLNNLAKSTGYTNGVHTHQQHYNWLTKSDPGIKKSGSVIIIQWGAYMYFRFNSDKNLATLSKENYAGLRDNFL